MKKIDIYFNYLERYNYKVYNNIIIIYDISLAKFIDSVYYVFGLDFFKEFKNTTFKCLYKTVDYRINVYEEIFYLNYKGNIKTILKKNLTNGKDVKVNISYKHNIFYNYYIHNEEGELVSKFKFDWNRKKLINSVTLDNGLDIRFKKYSNLKREDKINLSRAIKYHIRNGTLEYRFF